MKARIMPAQPLMLLDMTMMIDFSNGFPECAHADRRSGFRFDAARCRSPPRDDRRSTSLQEVPAESCFLGLPRSRACFARPGRSARAFRHEP